MTADIAARLFVFLDATETANFAAVLLSSRAFVRGTKAAQDG